MEEKREEEEETERSQGGTLDERRERSTVKITLPFPVNGPATGLSIMPVRY